MSKGSPVVLIAVIVVALGGLAFLNGAFQGTPVAEHDDAKEAAKEAPSAKKPAPSPMDSGANDLVALGDDAVLGDKNGKKELVIGYSWTPAVQSDPSKVYKTIEMAQKGLPGARIRVVNVDAHPEVKPGLSVDGKMISPPAPDGALDVPEQAVMGLRQMMGAGGPPSGSGPPTRPIAPPAP